MLRQGLFLSEYQYLYGAWRLSIWYSLGQAETAPKNGDQERAKVGLQPLKLDSNLSAMANDKAADMANNHYFDHISPTYGSPFEMTTLIPSAWVIPMVIGCKPLSENGTNVTNCPCS